MGMFDEITCHYPLPKTGYKIPVGHDGWQTKDLENCMVRYRITEDGTLLEDVGKREWVDAPERPLIGGYLKRVTDEWRDTEYHGDIVFYDRFALPEGGRLWAEFRARFTDGEVSSMDVVELREDPPPKQEKIGNTECDVTENAYGIGLKVVHLGNVPLVEREES